MEKNLGPTIGQMVQNDQLRMCSCGHDKAIFYCMKACDNEITTHQQVFYCFDKNNCNCTIIKKSDIFCCISDINYQREYCVVCGEQNHDHGSIRIIVLVFELDKHHWSLLFEKISHLQEQASQKYEPYEDLVILLEDIYKKKVVRDPQSSPLFSDMHQMLKSLFEEITMRYKEKIEELINQKNVTELFKLKNAFHSFNSTYETVKPLENFDPQVLYERYIEIFQYPFNKESLINLVYPNFLLIKDYKKKFVESLISSQNQIIPVENKQEVINQLFLEYFTIEEIQNIKITQEFNQKLIQEVQNNNRIDEVNKKALMDLQGKFEQCQEEAKHFVVSEEHNKELAGIKKEIDVVIEVVQKDLTDKFTEQKQIIDDLSQFKNDISLEINQMNSSNNQKYDLLNSEILSMKQLLQKRIEDLNGGKDTIEFEGKQWKVLFGVNAGEKFAYNHGFWTQKQELNAEPDKRSIKYLNSFKLKAFWEQKIEQLLIFSQSGMHTILKLPSNNKSLLDYFNDEETVTNLTYVSGAKDPVELINKKQGIKFYEQVWRINSKRTDGGKFMTRLGGYYYDRYDKDERYKDNKQQVIYYEMAGFGILDENSNIIKRVYGNKSFGIRTISDYTDGQGQVQIGAIVCAL